MYWLRGAGECTSLTCKFLSFVNAFLTAGNYRNLAPNTYNIALTSNQSGWFEANPG